MRILKDFKIPDFKFPKFKMKEISEIDEVKVDYEAVKKAEENQKKKEHKNYEGTHYNTIKEAFAINFLPTAQIWIDMVKDRNTSSHEYNMDKVNLMLERISKVYCEELVRFQDDLRNLI